MKNPINLNVAMLKRVPCINLICVLYICIGVVSCQTKSQNKATKNSPNTWYSYENSYISIKYPTDYEITGDFRFGADNLQSVVTTSQDSMCNELYIEPRKASKDKPWLKIVLSRYKLQLPVSEFMQISMWEKETKEKDCYLISDIDSTSFAGYPATSATFAHAQEFGDTIIQKQFIVQLPNYELYFINVGCYQEIKNDSARLAPAFNILKTLKFKHTQK